MKLAKKLSLLAALVMLAIPFGNFSQTQAQALPYDGIKATVLTFTGPQIAEPLQRRAPEFKKLTGADITIATVPNADLYNTILKDQSTGTNAYQGFVLYPQWLGDFASAGYMQPLDDYIKADKDIQWDDEPTCWKRISSSRLRPGTII